MAVVYADLRFSRKATPPRKGVAPESPCDDWEVTYENVTPLRDIQGGEEQRPPHAKEPKRSCAAYNRYFLVTLCVISLISLTIIITLSTQLSQVTQRYDETSVTLKILWQEHEHLKSNLTTDILTKDSVARDLQETLRKTEELLGTAKNDLMTSQKERWNTYSELQNTLREKEKTDTELNNLKINLQNTQNQLQEKSDQLSGCDTNLRDANARNEKDKKEMNKLNTSLSSTNKKLKVIESNLAQTQAALSQVKTSMSALQKENESSQQELKTLQDLQEKKQKEANDCFSQSCDEGGDYEEDSDLYCPVGWKQIHEMCYYFSTEKKPRINANEDCKSKNSTLAKIQEGDSTLKEMIQKDGRSFWIGLSWKNNMWKWPDGSVYEGFQTQQGPCAKASPGLQGNPCSYPLPWICQVKTMKCHLTPENLRCFFEKIGVFGEKIKTKDSANGNFNQDERTSGLSNSQS